MPDIEKFDPTTLAGKVAERVKTTIGDLIPEEQWQAMVTRQVKLYLEGETIDDPTAWPRGSKKITTPPLAESIIRVEVDKFIRGRITEELAKPEWTDQWRALQDGSCEYSVAPMIQKFITENAGQMLGSILSGAISVAMGNIRASIQSSGRY